MFCRLRMCFDDSGEINKKRTISFSNGNASTGRDDCTSPSNANHNDDSDGSRSGSSNSSSDSSSYFGSSYSNFFNEHLNSGTTSSFNVIIAQMVKDGDVEGLNQLLQDNEELNIEAVVFDNTNMRPLHLAVSKGRFNMVLFLLSKGVSPLVQDAAGRDALQWAHFCGNFEMHQLLAYHLKSGKQSFIRVAADDSDHSLSDPLISPHREHNEMESSGFSESNPSHYNDHDLALTPREVTDIDADIWSAATPAAASTGRASAQQTSSIFSSTVGMLLSKESGQCKRSLREGCVAPCSPLSMPSMGVDIDCAGSLCQTESDSAESEHHQSSSSAVQSPISRSVIADDENYDDTHTDYDEDLNGPTLTSETYHRQNHEDQHDTEGRLAIMVGDDDGSENMNEVADLVAKASQAVHAAQDEYLRLATSLNIIHAEVLEETSRTDEVDCTADCSHGDLDRANRTVSSPRPDIDRSQHQELSPCVLVKRHISFFERFAQREKKAFFTRPLRKAVSRIRRVMSGPSQAGAYKTAPQQGAAVFPLSPPMSPADQANPREEPVYAEVADSPRTNDSGGSAYSDQQTTLTWGTRKHLRRTNPTVVLNR